MAVTTSFKLEPYFDKVCGNPMIGLYFDPHTYAYCVVERGEVTWTLPTRISRDAASRAELAYSKALRSNIPRPMLIVSEPPEDDLDFHLISDLAGYLEHFDPVKFEWINDAYPELKIAVKSPLHPLWKSEDLQVLIDHFVNHLQSMAPEGCYFGTPTRESNKFGFWPIPYGDFK